MSRIFISYRRSDSTEIATAIHANLSQQIPAGAIFLDLARIDSGDDFSKVIFDHIQSCDVAIFIISPDWIKAIQVESNEQTNWARMEAETALRLNKIIVPVLINEESDFYQMELPVSLHELRKRHYHLMPDLEEEKLTALTDSVILHLDTQKEKRIETLARKIAKPPAAIKQVRNTIMHLIESGVEDPGPEDLWETLIELVKNEHGETRYKRILKNMKMTQSEDLGLVIFSCIVDGMFVSSDLDEPSDYWGLGSI